MQKTVEPDTRSALEKVKDEISIIDEALSESKPRYLELETRFVGVERSLEKVDADARAEHQEMLDLRRNNDALYKKAITDSNQLKQFAQKPDVTRETREHANDIRVEYPDLEADRESLRHQKEVLEDTIETIKEILVDAKQDIKSAERARELQREQARRAAAALAASQEAARNASRQNSPGNGGGRNGPSGGSNSTIGF